MSQVTKVLFPVDFSEQSAHTAPFVVAVMRRFQAEASLLHVVEPGYYRGCAAPLALWDVAAIREIATAELKNRFVREFQDLPTNRFVELGDAAEIIIAFAKSHATDLVMMPTRGHGPLRRFLLGSVTAKVLDEVHCPVWTAVHGEGTPMAIHTECNNVLCAVDGSERCVPVLRWANQFAEETDSSLQIVHVMPGPGEWLSRQMERHLESELRSQARSAIDKLQNSAGVSAPVRISVGEVVPSVIRAAGALGSDVLIIGRGVIHQTWGRLRSHSYEIIRAAPCPVISV